MRMKRYKQYKPTGISWLPEIPAHWDTMRIRGLFEESIEKTVDDSGTLLSLSQYTGVSLKSEAGKTGMFEAESTTGYKIVHPGQFVMNIMLAWNGSYAVSDLEGIISPAYCVFDFRIPCVKRYFDYLLRTKIYSGAFRTQSRGIIDSRLRLYPNKFYSFKAIVPPIEEQKKIVAFLDKKITLIESCKCQIERELRTLNELKQAEIASVVTRGLNPNVPMKDSGIPWIGQIPAHWTMMRIKNLLEESKVKSIDGHEQSLSLSKSAGVIPYEEKENRTMQSASLVGAKVVQCGDVVFNRFKARLFAISNYDGVVSPDYAVYKGKGRANLNYLVSLFGTEMYRAAFDRKASGIGDGFSRLYTADLFSMYAIIPPIEEQNEIVKYIALKTNQIDSMIEALNAEIDRLTEYKQRLISDVVTGQINVQNEQV